MYWHGKAKGRFSEDWHFGHYGNDKHFGWREADGWHCILISNCPAVSRTKTHELLEQS